MRLTCAALLFFMTLILSSSCTGQRSHDHAPQDKSLQFLVIGCGPYIPQEEVDLARYMTEENARREGQFMIYLGDIHQKTDPEEGMLDRMSNILKRLEVPVFVVPGDNEWNDMNDPDLAWKYWTKYFMHFENHWAQSNDFFSTLYPASNGVQHQDVRPENHCFIRQGVLFVGLNLPGGRVHDLQEWTVRLTQNAQWVQQNFERYGSKVRAAVIYAQSGPSPDHRKFFVSLQTAAERFDKPILYLHADGHKWFVERSWPQKNILRVQTDRLGIAHPLLVTVKPHGPELFEFDRRNRRGPYLAMGTSNSMTVVWRTNHPIQPAVHIGRSPDKLKRTISHPHITVKTTGNADVAKSLHSAAPEAYQYEAYIGSLKPNTKYYYAVSDADRHIHGGDSSYHFVTSPPTGDRTPFRFWVVGDSGTGDQNQADVHAAMRRFTAQSNHPLDLFLHVGDMVYPRGEDIRFDDRFFRPYDITLRNVTCWPAMGNHEGYSSSGQTGIGPYYDAFVLPKRAEVGGVASGTEAYYSFDYANVHFIVLNSHDLDRDPTGAMARWLNADLEQAHSDWIIAYWHHPPYTKGTHDSDTEIELVEMRTHIVPILEAGGVDVVFTGHSHIYERSMLMDGAYETPTVAESYILDDGDGDPAGDGAYRKSAGLHPHEGTVQVVTGHGGQGTGRGGTMPVMKRISTENGSVIVDVNGDNLTAIMLSSANQQRDLFSIVKRDNITQTRIANPRQLPP